MPKRILIFFLVPFIMLSVVTCDNTPYEEPESTGTINISLVLPLDKGSIEVNYYQIVDVSITITAPDSTQEIRTWQPGDSTTLIFQNKGTGTYHISIWERDSDNNEFTYDEFFTVTHGYNVVITVYLGGNIIVEIVPGDTPEFTEFQRIPTIGALDWEAFTIGRHTFLAVANSSDDSTFNLASRIYQWNGIQFSEIQAIPTQGAFDWEAIYIGTELFLAVANCIAGNVNNYMGNIDSVIYKLEWQ